MDKNLIYTGKLSPAQADTLKNILLERGYSFGTVQYALFSARNADTNITLYKTYKLVVQGKGTKDFIEFILEPEVLKEIVTGYDEVRNPGLYLPRIGVDESGKGDFFGPLCVAGAYVNSGIAQYWREAGVDDSKKIGSDDKIAKLAQLIRQTPGAVYNVVAIGNDAYNRLHTKMKTVNALLAWGHARVIENLMMQSVRMDPPAVKAISDQFAQTKTTVERALMNLGKSLPLEQMHKAESDIAVAAASILARDEFASRMEKMSEFYGMKFPKGAVSVVDAGKEFVKKYGKEELSKVCKMHFRTTYTVLGLPPPPKTEWHPIN